MTSFNVSDPADGLSQNVDGLYAPMPSVVDAPISTATTTPEQANAGHWGDGLRGAVRDNPLAAVGAAAVIGMLLVRLTR